MKYGFEKEYFLMKGKQGIQILGKDPYKNIPYDECGYLVEARGKPMDTVIDAVFSLKAEEHRILTMLGKIAGDLLLIDTPIQEVTRDFKREVQRLHSKPRLTFENMYDFKDNRHKHNEVTAAIHISFTNPVEYDMYKDGKFTHKSLSNRFFDFIKYVKALDKAFKEEIRIAKRNPGFYEIKSDGRVEYRSLPANADFNKIINVIDSVK